MPETPTATKKPHHRLGKSVVNQVQDPATGRLVSTFNREEVADRLLALLATGMTIRQAHTHEGMPCVITLHNWRKEDPAFAARYYEAVNAGFDTIAEQCLEIADRPAKDMADVQNRKLQIETRLKLLAKWCPRKYGERIAIDGEVTVRMSPLEQLRRLEDKAANRTVIDAETGEEVLPNAVDPRVGGVANKIIPKVAATAWNMRRKAELAAHKENEAMLEAAAAELAGTPDDTTIDEGDCF